MGTRPMTKDEIEAYKISNPKSQAKTTKCPHLFSEAGETYIQEVIWEIKSGLPIDRDAGYEGRDSEWGSLLERYVYNECTDLDTRWLGHTFFPHHDPLLGKYWGGSPDTDNKVTDTVGDIKSPGTRRSFFTFHDCKDIQEVREKHKDGNKYYWQLVSNAVILGRAHCELVIFMPYLDELDAIRSLPDAPYWVVNGKDSELPHLLRGHHYENVKRFIFTPPKEDRELIEARVRKAIEKVEKTINK
jgi:hypothetical protein